MSRETLQKTIDGVEFLFTELDTRRAYRIHRWLTAHLGQAAGRSVRGIKSLDGINGVKDLLDSKNIDLPFILEQLSGVLDNLTDPVVEEYTDYLLDGVLYKGKPLTLDSIVFQGRMKLLSKVVIEAVKYNFSDFFDGAGENVENILRKTPSKDTTSETATSQTRTG